MLDIGILNILFDVKFLAAAVAGVVAFATIITLGLPMMDRSTLNKRLKAVSERREELRARHHAALQKRASLRTEPVGFMKQTLERLKLSNMLESPDTRDKLAQAGYRGQAPMIAFLFFRFAAPFIVFALALLYIFVLTNFNLPGLTKLMISIGAGLIGYYLPDLFISNLISRRRESIMRGFPDALDLMLICVESGMSIEATFNRVASESRDMRMNEAEKKAAALPPKLTVPMILFFLPVLFAIILGPAGIQVSQRGLFGDKQQTTSSSEQ
ncbi:MAG: type II secretion system F family protein [Alphaproteobacteria bacterium]|nr:type II secretion system F family protein [Alphaproteobacteria bacterium]